MGIYNSLNLFSMLDRIRGLPNLGNTCYLNSIIQILLNMQCLKKYLFSIELCDREYCLPCGLRRLLEWYLGKGTGDITRFLTCLMINNKEYRNNDQHDTYLIFLYIINIRVDNHLNFNLFKYFMIDSTSTLQCTKCKKKSRRSEKMNSLSLEYTSTLQGSIHKYLEKEVLSDKIECTNCNTSSYFKKYLRIKKTSKILVIHIKRFTSDYYKLKKISKDIEIPDTLNINRKIYRIFGFIVHKGNINNGHYRSFLINSREWYMFDDTLVKSVNIKEYLNQAYVIFYERII